MSRIARDVTLIDPDLLALSPLNPRQHIDPGELAALADSIAACGLIHPLAVLHSPGETGPDAPPEWAVVAGGRRLRAIQALRKDGRWPQGAWVPCTVTDDAEQARAWSMAENTARVDLTPADEITAYGAAARAGASPRDIALAYGVHERHVRGRLKLADLPPGAIGALRDRRLTLDQAEALTLAPDAETAGAFLADALSGMPAYSIRNRLLSSKPRLTDKRVKFVGLENYRAAGGTITQDLFGDDERIEDEALLDDLFAEAVAKHAETLRARGWLWSDYSDLPSWEQGRGMIRLYPGEILDDSAGALDFTPEQMAVSGVFFGVAGDGSLFPARFGSAWVRPADEGAARAAGVLPPDDAGPGATPAGSPDADDGPDMSAALLADLRAGQLHAVQAALVCDSDLLVSLVAFQIAPDSGWVPGIFDLRLGRPRNAPQVADGFEPSNRLDIAEQDGTGRPDLAAAFAAFRTRTTPEQRLSLVLTALARTLHWGCRQPGPGGAPSAEAPDPLWQVILDATQADPRSHWTPTKDSIFARMRSAALDAVHAELLDLPDHHRALADFRAMKKGAKANLLHLIFTGTPAQRAGVAGWSPDAEARVFHWFPQVA